MFKFMNSKQNRKDNMADLLTRRERVRIEQIRRNIIRQERAGADTSTWEAPFFLHVIDRLTSPVPHE